MIPYDLTSRIIKNVGVKERKGGKKSSNFFGSIRDIGLSMKEEKEENICPP